MIYEVDTGGQASIKRELVGLYKTHIYNDIFWPEECYTATTYLYLHFYIGENTKDVTHSQNRIFRYKNVSVEKIKQIILENSKLKPTAPINLNKEFQPIKFNLAPDYDIVITKNKVKIEGLAVDHSKILELAEVIKQINK